MEDLLSRDAPTELSAVLSVKNDPAKLSLTQVKGASKHAMADSPEWKEAEKSECIRFDTERRL